MVISSYGERPQAHCTGCTKAMEVLSMLLKATRIFLWSLLVASTQL